MNTFLPHPDFSECAKVLDLRRLGKQIIECRQIFKAIMDPEYGWQNRPAVNMWRGYGRHLFWYAGAMGGEWVSRTDRGHGAWSNILTDPIGPLLYQLDIPPWLGDERLHSSHRSNLLRKDPEHYGQFGWTEPHDIEYFWPSKSEE